MSPTQPSSESNNTTGLNAPAGRSDALVVTAVALHNVRGSKLGNRGNVGVAAVDVGVLTRPRSLSGTSRRQRSAGIRVRTGSRTGGWSGWLERGLMDTRVHPAFVCEASVGFLGLALGVFGQCVSPWRRHERCLAGVLVFSWKRPRDGRRIRERERVKAKTLGSLYFGFLFGSACLSTRDQ